MVHLHVGADGRRGDRVVGLPGPVGLAAVLAGRHASPPGLGAGEQHAVGRAVEDVETRQVDQGLRGVAAHRRDSALDLVAHLEALGHECPGIRVPPRDQPDGAHRIDRRRCHATGVGQRGPSSHRHQVDRLEGGLAPVGALAALPDADDHRCSRIQCHACSSSPRESTGTVDRPVKRLGALGDVTTIRRHRGPRRLHREHLPIADGRGPPPASARPARRRCARHLHRVGDRGPSGVRARRGRHGAPRHRHRRPPQPPPRRRPGPPIW